MTRYVGKGVAILTMDDTFLQNRDKLNRHPDGTVGIVLRPLQDIANGVYCGLVGIVRVPYHGAKRNGALGFASGLGKGIAGVATKPVVGILDSITHIGEGSVHCVVFISVILPFNYVCGYSCCQSSLCRKVSAGEARSSCREAAILQPLRP